MTVGGNKTGKVNQEKKRVKNSMERNQGEEGKISARSESKRLEIRVHGKRKIETQTQEAELKTKVINQKEIS